MTPDSIRILLESAPDGYFVHDVEGRILDVNERSCIDLGYSREHLLTKTINDISCGATPAENAAIWANAPPGLSLTFRQVAKRSDGSTFPVEISITCQTIDEQKLFLGLARDISDREAARIAIERSNSDLEYRVDDRTRELREAREKLQAVMDSAHDAILFQDREGRYQVVSKSAEMLSGIRASDALGKTAIDLFGSDIGQRIRSEEERVLSSGETSTSEESLPLLGESKSFLTTRSVHRSPLGEVTGLVTIARDVTDLKKNEQRIRQEHDRLMLAASVGGLGIWDYDLRRDALTCDAQWYRIMGRDPNRPISSIAEFREFIHPDDVDRATEVDETAARLVADKEDYSIVFRIVRPDGEIRWVRSAASVMEDMAGIPSRAVGFVVDITETRLAEATLERQALEDSLTSIANRRRFDQEFERACLQASRTGEPLALAIVDVDFFKNYNDHYGHAEGDAALKSVARILSSATRRPYDLAARYGGEEFMLLMPATQHPETVLDGINAELASLRLPHATSPIGPYLTVSCGCVVAAQPGSISPADILAESDRALYRAKQGGRNRFVVVQL